MAAGSAARTSAAIRHGDAAHAAELLADLPDTAHTPAGHRRRVQHGRRHGAVARARARAARTANAWLDRRRRARRWAWSARRGRGSCEHFGLGADDVPVLVGTFGKAFGTFGAFVAGDADLIEFLMQKSRTYIYTTALPPAVAAATRAALRVSERESLAARKGAGARARVFASASRPPGRAARWSRFPHPAPSFRC